MDIGTLSPGEMRPGREADHSPLSLAKVTNVTSWGALEENIYISSADNFVSS
jgi:hypothetical protein